MSELPDGFTSEVRFHPGYDHRDMPGRGAHGMEIEFVLHGPLATMSARINTGWMVRPIAQPLVPGMAPLRINRVGLDRSLIDCFPTGQSVSIHAPSQLQGWWYGPADCDLLTGARCYGDAGYSMADDLLNLLVEGGDAAVWARLLQTYESWTRVAEDVTA